MNVWDSIKADIAKTLGVDEVFAENLFYFIEDNFMVDDWSEATHAELRRIYFDALEEMALG